MNAMPRRAQQTQLPKGAKLYLPDEAAQKRVVEERLLGVFRRWGYREVVTPAYEYFDVIAQGTDRELQERMFKMVDRDSGRLLALRADITPQIARIVATRMREEPKPLRLAYVSNVFRYDEPHVGRYREFYQAGVELIGLPNPEADAEMIAMTVEGLQLLGLERFQIDVGQTEFFRGILEDLAANEATGHDLRSALGHKDQSALERIVAELRAPSAVTEMLLALPALYGRGDVLDRAERLVKSARSEAALQNLAEVYRLLRAYGLADSVVLDLGEVRGFDYYSGVHFEAYVSGLGASLAGGGPIRPDAEPVRLRLPGHGLRLRDRPGAPGHDVPGQGGGVAGARTSSSSTSRRRRRGRWRSRAASGMGDGRWRGTSSADPSTNPWPTRGSSAPAGRWSSEAPERRKGRSSRVRAVELETGAERMLEIADVLADPARHFAGTKGAGHA